MMSSFVIFGPVEEHPAALAESLAPTRVDGADDNAAPFRRAHHQGYLSLAYKQETTKFSFV
jgi:hypothetical protein